MPTITTIAEYMTAIARINLATPTNILVTTHKEPESLIRLQAYKILATYGTPKEMKFAMAWLRGLQQEISEADADTENKTVTPQPETHPLVPQPAQEASINLVV